MGNTRDDTKYFNSFVRKNRLCCQATFAHFTFVGQTFLRKCAFGFGYISNDVAMASIYTRVGIQNWPAFQSCLATCIE